MVRSFTICLLAVTMLPCLASAADRQTERVILVTTDGMRWQEVFTGAEEALMTKEAGLVEKPEPLKKKYWRDTPQARREALMPFLWSTIAKQGQVYGNQTKGSIARVTNERRLSYPGYNEMLTGFVNPKITSNAFVNNETPTVLEWLHHKDAFAGKVAAFSAWRLMPFIINRDRCGFPVMGGWEPVPNKQPNAREQLLNELMTELTPSSQGEVYDAILYHAAVEHLLANKPRVMFISFLETDHWGHTGQYENVLVAAHAVDDYVRKLWELTQSLPEYKGKTTIILTTDHGRGSGAEPWKHHNAQVEGAENIWLAAIGPDTPALGERTNIEPITQNQIAATIAALLGEDYNAAVPQAGKPIAAVLGKPAP